MSTGAFPPPTAHPGADWYAVLGVDAGAADADIAAAAERLSRQASALANAAPDRSQQLRDTVRSIRSDLLSGPAARARYDDRLAASRSVADQAPPPAPGTAPLGSYPPPAPGTAPLGSYPPPAAPPPGATWPGAATPGPGGPAPAAGQVGPAGPAAPGQPNVVDSVVAGIAPIASRFRRFLQSGWTCPGCGAEGGPGDKFCSKCGGPMKVQAPAAPPPPAARSVCPSCSTAVAPGARFCAKCGTPVG